MKHTGKYVAILLAACLLLTACGQPGQNVPVASESPAASELAPETTFRKDDLQALRDNLLKMDGSTSLIPLEAGIRAALFDISLEEATGQVVHTTTYGSFNNLLNGAADLIFSVPLSEGQLATAAEEGVELEQIPIAKEGFVFVVNADNPVDSLTQQQLRDIYSGKITNWSEVGGNDEPIIAYQRNQDSGSQNYMIAFMGDTPLMDAPTERRPATMFGLMDVIAVNDYAAQSIGYSVYAYAADMYGNGDEIKFLAIDGVAPSKATMASGEYPLLSENYAIFRTDEPEDSPVRTLCAWMTSDEGQRAIAEAGYVTVRDIGFDYSEQEVPAGYSGEGQGYLESWVIPLWESQAVSTENLYTDALPLTITLPDDYQPVEDYGELTPYTTGITYELDCLVNQELQADINVFLAEAVAQADAQSEELLAHIDSLNTGEYLTYSQCHDTALQDCFPSAIVAVKAKNGYIWATVAQMYYLNVQDGYDKYYRTQCRTWDLLTGKELSVEELFRKGLDVDEYLNTFLRMVSQTPVDSWGIYPQMKEDFARLPETGWATSPEAIYIDLDNLYFAEGLKFSLEEEMGVLCAEVYRDMEGLFTDSATVRRMLYETPHDPQYAYLHDEFFTVELLDETVGNAEIRASINADFLSRVEPFTRENATAYFNELGIGDQIDNFDPLYSWNVLEYGDRLAVFTSYGQCVQAVLKSEKYETVPWPETMGTWFYDLQTGKRLEWRDLLMDGWETQAFTYGEEGDFIPFQGDSSALPTLGNFMVNWQYDPERPLCFWFRQPNWPEEESWIDLFLPFSALKLAQELS